MESMICLCYNVMLQYCLRAVERVSLRFLFGMHPYQPTLYFALF